MRVPALTPSFSRCFFSAIFCLLPVSSRANIETAFKKMLSLQTEKQVMRKFDDESRLIEFEREGKGFSYYERSGDQRTLILSDKEVSPALNMHLGFGRGEYQFGQTILGPKREHLLFKIDADLFTYHLQTNTVRRLGQRNTEKSLITVAKDESFVLWVEDGNIWLCDLLEGYSSYPLTTKANDRVKNGVLAWVYEEEIFGRGQPIGYWISPDQEKIAFLETDESIVEMFPLVDHTQLVPKPILLAYPKAGKTNPKVRLAYVPISGGEPVFIDLGVHNFSDHLISGVGFSADGNHLFYQVQDRIQSSLALYSYCFADGVSTRIWFEKSSDFVNRLQEAPLSMGGDDYLWLSSESGFAHIYKLKIVDGKLESKTQLTSGEWDVGSILYTTLDRVVFSARKDDVCENHLYGLNCNTGGIERFSSLGFNYGAVFAKDGKKALIVESRFDSPSRTILLYFSEEKPVILPRSKLSAEIASELEKEDRGFTYEYITYPSASGVDLKGVLLRPGKIEEGKKYPLLVHSYSGPHIPATINRLSENNAWNQYMANKGFYVLVCDSANAQRPGHEFLAKSYQNLGELELKDILSAIDFAVEKNPEVDNARVGIWGWSYGGYMASFALTHSDRFKAGVAVAPVTDWSLYDSVYTERYMNTPQANPEGYKTSSVLAAAENLKGRLLLVHGTMDDNVHDQNSIQLAHALSKKGIAFDMMSYAQSSHGMSPAVIGHLYSRLEEFFLKNL